MPFQIDGDSRKDNDAVICVNHFPVVQWPSFLPAVSSKLHNNIDPCCRLCDRATASVANTPHQALDPASASPHLPKLLDQQGQKGPVAKRQIEELGGLR